MVEQAGSGPIAARLAALGVELPDAPAPAANYVPFMRSGDLLFVSGQLPFRDGAPIKGKLGLDASLDEGVAAARACALALMAQAKAACAGDLERIRRVVKLTGFVNAAPDFTDHPTVINGASDLVAAVFGDAGRHARAAIGCSSLPLGAMVEIEGVFELT